MSITHSHTPVFLSFDVYGRNDRWSTKPFIFLRTNMLNFFVGFTVPAFHCLKRGCINRLGIHTIAR
eukprot:Gb_30483 [translate_table: standard]